MIRIFWLFLAYGDWHFCLWDLETLFPFPRSIPFWKWAKSDSREIILLIHFLAQRCFKMILEDKLTPAQGTGKVKFSAKYDLKDFACERDFSVSGKFRHFNYKRFSICRIFNYKTFFRWIVWSEFADRPKCFISEFSPIWKCFIIHQFGNRCRKEPGLFSI